MTKDRARKQAARARAASTGERYVVARRAAVDVEDGPPRGGRLHELTHRMPGVPAHLDGGLQGRASRNQREPRPAHTPRRQPHGEPRVLVAWQNWIAKRFGAGPR